MILSQIGSTYSLLFYSTIKGAFTFIRFFSIQRKKRHFSVFDEKFDAKVELIENRVVCPKCASDVFDSIYISTKIKRRHFLHIHLFSGGEQKKVLIDNPFVFHVKAFADFIWYSFSYEINSLVYYDTPKISLLFAPITQIKKWSIQRLILMPGLFTSFIRTAEKTNRRCGEQKSWKTNRTKEMNRFTWWFVDLKWEREQTFLTKNVFDMKNSQQLVGLHSCGTIACVRACLSVCLYDFFNICLSVKGIEQANNNHVVATRIEMLTRVDIYKPQ